jgi:NAD-dependent DNA ligase
MTTEQLNLLKEACNSFYMNIGESKLSDLEYDALVKEYEASGNSVKDLVNWELDKTFPNEELPPLNKIIANDNDLKSTVTNFINDNKIIKLVINYKYDGSSIKAYYENGNLVRILGTPDVEFGFLRTKAFWNLFPHKVNPDIRSIQGEVLVDADVYGQLARNKANGLTNSKWKDEEVDNEAFIRVYKINYVDNNWSLLRQSKSFSELETIVRERKRPRFINNEVTESTGSDIVFSPAKVLYINEIPTEPIVHTEEVAFQVDGVVIYTDNIDSSGDPLIRGIKFYYTEYADTRVTKIQWNQKPNGSYSPVLIIDTIELNGKYINKVSSGGVPNLIGNKMGVGAKVRVILANLTIPKVIKVIEQSEVYNYPKCECGYQLSDGDIFGSTLKCQERSKPCTHKVKILLRDCFIDEFPYISKAKSENKSFDDYFYSQYFWYLDELKIDRWSSESKLKINLDKTELHPVIATEILNCIKYNSIDDLLTILDNNFYFTELNWDTLLVNVRSWMYVMNKIYTDWQLIDESYISELEDKFL